MIEIKKITREIIQYSIIGAAVCEVVSLAVIGPGVVFPYGLVLGLATGIIAMRLLASSLETVTKTRRAGAVTSGYVVRILLYALALYLCARTGGVAFAGCAIGLLLPKAALTVSQLVTPKIRRALGKEEPETEHFVLVADPRGRLFVKTQGMMKDRGGRTYLTYRRFKHYKLVQEELPNFMYLTGEEKNNN
ncbi:hypothetical protein AGMMS49983_08650 [Clostridia bacterium]|nr:hypothetical protein AGMMS49983_08650 [Clostridia bacterium]